MRIHAILAMVILVAVWLCGSAMADQAMPAEQPSLRAAEQDTEAKLDELQRQLKELQRQIDELRKTPSPPAGDEEDGDEFLQEEEGYETAPEPRSTQSVQRELPDISVIGDIRGSWTDDRDDAGRNKVRLYHAELALQNYLYPNIRGDVIIGVAREGDDFNVHVEEGYINFLDIGGNLGVLAGRKFVPFGKANATHAHHRLYSDTPTAMTTFFGDRLVGDGALVSYLVPTKTFLRLELGSWHAAAHSHDAHEEHDHEAAHAGLGLLHTVNTARLWTSHSLGKTSELEFGASHAITGDARASGIDLTYKRWPTAYKRLTVLAEYLWGKNMKHDMTLDGLYVLANQRLDKYWDVGLRYDLSDTPECGDGRASGLVGIVTKHLTETSYIRLQCKHAHLPDGGTGWEPMLVFSFGMGPHAHPLE